MGKEFSFNKRSIRIAGMSENSVYSVSKKTLCF